MGVSLNIKWTDYHDEEVVISSVRGYHLGWTPMAESLGLTYFPQFARGFWIEPHDVVPLVEEAMTIRSRLSRMGSDAAGAVEILDHLLGAFERLRTTDGWVARISPR